MHGSSRSRKYWSYVRSRVMHEHDKPRGITRRANTRRNIYVNRCSCVRGRGGGRARARPRRVKRSTCFLERSAARVFRCTRLESFSGGEGGGKLYTLGTVIGIPDSSVCDHGFRQRKRKRMKEGGTRDARACRNLYFASRSQNRKDRSDVIFALDAIERVSRVCRYVGRREKTIPAIKP